MTECSKTHIQD